MSEKNGMDSMTKGFIIFMASAFAILTLVIIFGGHSYELKNIGKGNQPAQAQSSSSQNQGSASSSNGEFQPYAEEMHRKISDKWTPPSVNKDSEVILEFTILKTGQVKDEKVFKSSGDKAVDDSALAALRKAVPLPPLPLNFPRDEVTVKFNFTVKANQY